MLNAIRTLGAHRYLHGGEEVTSSTNWSIR